MKDDIIGTFGVLIIGLILLVMMTNYQGDFDVLWPGVSEVFESENRENQNEDENVQVATVFDGDEKDLKKKEAWPYIVDQVSKKFGKKERVVESIGQYFLWPSNTKGEYTPIAGVKALAIEYQHDPTGKNFKTKKSFVGGVMRRLGFKEVKKKECQTNEMTAFADCVAYYERGNEKCVMMVIYEPINKLDQEAVTAKKMQTKIYCGSV